MPSTLGAGRGRRAPSNHREARRALGATSSSPRPSSAHRSAAHGTRTRKASAPSSTSRPVSSRGLVAKAPPTRGSASSTVTVSSGWSTTRRWAAVRPEIPAPTTTTREPTTGQLPFEWAWTCSTTRSRIAGSVSGSTPWPRLNTWPGCPPLRRRMSATSASTTSAGPRHTAGSRLP